MATVTTPDNIAADDDSDAYDPAGAYATLQTSVQAALSKRENYTFLWADAAARTAETDMVTMSLGFQQDTKTTYIYNGTAWKLWHTAQPIAYTPTWTNLTVGSAVQLWTYTVAAGMVTVAGYITLGAGSSVGAGPYMTLPLPANGLITGAPSSGNNQVLGTAYMEDAGVSFYDGKMLTLVSGGVVYVKYVALNTAGTYSVMANITSTVPFTWASGDYLTATYTYRAD